MYKFAAQLTLAAVAATLMAGCNAPLAPVSVSLASVAKPAATAASGKLRVAIAPSAAKTYSTLATKDDVSLLRLTLTGSNGQKQTKKASPKDTYVTFDQVSAGKASLVVEAFDKADKPVGKGQNGAVVAAGKTTQLHVDVKLDPNAGSGNVEAIVTFTETTTPDPEPRDGEEAFAKADLNKDGWLSMKEFVTNWPHSWGGRIDYPVPVAMTAEASVPGAIGQPIAPMPPICVQPMDDVKANDQAIAKPIWHCPPFDPAGDEFRRLDANGDNRLSLDEFLSRGPGVIMY